MEPRLSMEHQGPERSPQMRSVGSERLTHPDVEARPESLHEQAPREQVGRVAPAASLPPVLPPPLPVNDDTVQDVQASSHPVAAADDDLIEKEWVDKAKEIISQTKDDPYRREEEVGRLQADYLEKRYGRKLGAS